MLTLDLYAYDRYLPAMRDDFRAARYSPAALAWEPAAAIAAEISASDIDQSDVRGDIYVNAPYASYNAEITDAVTRHYLAVGIRPVDWLGIGSSLVIPSSGEAVTPSGQVLIRPLNELSISTSFAYQGLTAPLLSASLAARPFSRLITLGVGSTYNIAENRIELPRVELHLTPVDGIRIEGGFDIERSEGFANLAISVGHAQVGGGATLPVNTAAIRGTGWAQVTARPHRSIISSPPRRLVRINAGPIVEQNSFASTSIYASFNRATELLDHLASLREMCADNTVGGLLYEREGYYTSFANFLEIHAALRECKDKGKEIYFYNLNYGPLNYLLAASLGDGIYLHPHGRVVVVGFQSVQPYLADLLDNIGIRFINYRVAAHKTAFNFLSEDELTDAERENRQPIVDNYQEQYNALITAGRGEKLTADLERLIVQDPQLYAQGPKTLGLVDELVAEHELEDFLRDTLDFSTITDQQQYIDEQWYRPLRSSVALIHVVGSINSAPTERGVRTNYRDVRMAMTRALNDPAVRAIVLRINSPGGSALESSELADFIYQSRGEKPIIAWMGSVAASGAYYISAACDYIFASPVTITGSIGVIAGLLEAEKLYDEWGIEWDGVKSRRDAELVIPLREPPRNIEENIRNGVTQAYNTFVESVATYRDINQDAVYAVAEGRVWTAPAALERNLIDRIGSHAELESYIAETIDSNIGIRFVSYEITSSSFDADLGALAHSIINEQVDRILPSILTSNHAQIVRDIEHLIADNQILYLYPVAVDRSY